ncbi:hypothetical protein L226DRAFT_323088 [Lentinus tigrinus ALCF2SS1-7]|uniref:Uncharacterized protein n=1 Tax=Lentinus tigrinus ALCF2SS1-6 TaxID=1328759 RepID=A0A5C2SHP6_9APHY|nr:hypothetical protein L227DRAFT_436037 [Lentinus tigrinus ALCF2SS1-6]RPD77462.1 hypothetical protein L226DRAFT_323088 [Lentinus tigrinus ALCF2SS1-7]
MSIDILRPSLRLHQVEFDFSTAYQGPDAKQGRIRTSTRVLESLNVRSQPRRPLRTWAVMDRPSLLASVLVPLRPRCFDTTLRTQARASEPPHRAPHRATHRATRPPIHLSTYRTPALPSVESKVGRLIEHIHLHAHQRLGSGMMIGDAQRRRRRRCRSQHPAGCREPKRLAQTATFVHVRGGWGANP